MHKSAPANKYLANLIVNINNKLGEVNQSNLLLSYYNDYQNSSHNDSSLVENNNSSTSLAKVDQYLLQSEKLVKINNILNHNQT